MTISPPFAKGYGVSLTVCLSLYVLYLIVVVLPHTYLKSYYLCDRHHKR